MIYTDDWAFLHIPKNSGVNFKRRVPKELVRGTNYLPKILNQKIVITGISLYLIN